MLPVSYEDRLISTVWNSPAETRDTPTRVRLDRHSSRLYRTTDYATVLLRADEVLRGRPRQIPWTTNIRAPTFRNLLVAASLPMWVPSCQTKLLEL